MALVCATVAAAVSVLRPFVHMPAVEAGMVDVAVG